MKNFKSIIALFVLTVFSVNVWGGTKTCTVTSTTGTSSPVTINEVSWTYTLSSKNGNPSVTIANPNSIYGLKFGNSKNDYWGTVKLSTDYFSDKNITSVVVNVLNNGSKSATMTAKQGDVTIGSETKSFGQTYTDLTANTKKGAGGTLEITYQVAQASCFHSFTITYEDAPSCAAPTATSNGATTKTSQVVSWTDAAGSAWDIYYSTSSTTPTTQTTATSLTEKTYTFSGLTPNTKYYWWVRTNCGSGSTSAWKAGTAFTTNPITYTDYITECSSDPSISVSDAELSGFTYIYSQGPSTAKMVTVYGFYLQNNVTVTASDNYEICLSQDGTYTNTINLTPTDQMVNAPVYVRLKAGKDATSYNGTLTVASTGLDSKTVTLSGSVTPDQLDKPEVTATPRVHQITLSWEAVSNADSYQLVWNGGETETVTSPVTKTNLTGGQSYSYSITAIGSGNYSNSEAAISSAIAGKDTYTVKFFNSGSELDELEKHIEEGATLGTNLPTLTEANACDPHSRTFAGWTTAEAWTEPKTTFTEFVTPSTTVNDNMTLNAVWAEETVVPSEDFTQVTSLDVEEGNYVISYTYNSTTIILKNETSSQTELKAISQSPSSSKYTNPNEAYVWELKKENGNYSVYNASVKKYLNATSSGLTLSETPTYFTLSYSSGFYFTLTNVTGYYLSGFISGSNYTFQTTTSSSRKLYLYKQGTTIGCKNYITTCSTDPLIEVLTESLTGFSTIATTGNPSAAQSFTVEGYNLTEDITVTVAPTGYEVCLTEAGTYSASVTLHQSDGKVAKTPVYVRLAAAGTPADNVSGNISITSAGATTKNVALTGEVIAAVTVTFKNNDSTTDAPAAIKLGKGGTLGSNLPGVGSMTAPISGYTFVGWVADVDKWNGFTPSLTKSLITGNDPINDDVTYDAVWANMTNNFEIVREASGLTSGNYVINGYDDGDGTEEAMDNTFEGKEFPTKDHGVISTTDNSIIWNMTIKDNKYALRNLSTNTYFNFTSSSDLTLSSTPVYLTISGEVDEEVYKIDLNNGSRHLEYDYGVFDSYTYDYNSIYFYKQQISNFFVTTPDEYTVIWHKGNAGTATSSAFEGQTFADIVADAPTVADDAAGDCANKFMGWATATITKDEATESDVQWANETTISNSNKDFYAVFAQAEGTVPQTAAITPTDISGWTGMAYTTSYNKTSADGTTWSMQGVWTSDNKVDNLQMNSTSGRAITTPEFASNITKIEFNANANGNGTDITIYDASGNEIKSQSLGSTTDDYVINMSDVEYNQVKIANKTSGVIHIYSLTITYGSASYSNYVTQCTPKYDVKFYTDNGTTQYGETQSIEENGYATAPAIDPENDCSDFKGWSKTWGGDVVTVGEVQITEPTNFYAVWDAIKPVLEAEFPKDNQATQGFDAADLKVEVTAPTAGICLTYQWQKSTNATTGFEDILGATASTYTPSTVEANTTYYRCVVTNGNKSTTSRVATFSVAPVTKCFAPSISIATGKAGFIRSTLVTLTTETEGATIYYTTDGTTTPSAETSKYTVPFTITEDNTTIKAIAIKAEMTNSDDATATFYKATLQEIAVKDAPENTEYTALETFNPAGLVITASYDYELSEDIEYNEASKNDFSFNPALTTPLNVGDDEITIIYGDQEATQAITVNCIAIAAPAPSQPEAKQFTEVTIEWAVDEHADHYELSWEGGAAETVTSPYKKEGLTYSTTYHYTLTAVGKTNYCNASAENQEAKTKNRQLQGIDDTKPITCTHGDYFAGQTIKNTDFNVTLVYNNGDTEQGNPNYVGLSEPTTKETDALTEDQEGQLTVYLKSGSKTVSTTVTVANPSVTFNVPSGTEAPTAIHRGDNYPSMPNITDCGDNEYDYTFVGWVENTVDEETTTEPENIITAGTTCEITTDQVVYALYKRTVPAYRYKKIDAASTNNIVNGSYVIVHNNGYYVAATTSDSYPKAVAVTIEDDTIKDVVAAMKWNIEVGNTGLLTITNADGKYLRGKSSDTEIRVDATLDTWTAAVQNSNSKKYFTFQSTRCNASNRYMSINGTTDYRDYSNPSVATKIFSLYRYQEDVTTSAQYFITTPNCAKRKPVSLDLDITNVQREFYVNDAFNSNNLVVTAHFDNEDVEDVSASEFTSVTAPDMAVAKEEAIVTVSYTENEEKVSKTYTVLIKERVASVVTLVSAGRESTLEEDHYTGEQVNLPTEPSLTVKGYEFMGWSTEEIETPSSCPTTGFYAGGASFNLTQPAYTFYAVYALGAGSASDNDKFGLSIVTDPAGLVDGGMYMFTIANTSNTLAATTVSSSAIQTVTNFKTEQLQGNESYIWKLSASDDNTFKMQMSDAKYLSNTSNTNVSAQTNATDAVSWTLSYGTNSELGWRIQNTNTNGRFLGLSESGTTIKAYSPSDNNNWGKYPHVFTIYRLMGGYTTAPTLVVDGTDVTEIPEDFNGHVIVEEGDVTLDAATTWKNLTIKNGAKVTTNAALTIKDLLIETKMGAGTGKKTSPNIPASCGQLIIKEGGSVTANGTAIVENQIDPSGVASYGWYTFSVPFPVDALNGIYDTKGNKLINEYDYAIMDYHGDIRAQGQYGWKKYRGILQPGVMYAITVADTDFGTLRFKKTADGDVMASNSIQTKLYGDAESEETKGDANWNGLGNPNLYTSMFSATNITILQFYDHDNNIFAPIEKQNVYVVVGSSFFIQTIKRASGDGAVVIMEPEGTGSRGYRAPAREVEKEEPFIAVQLLQGEAMNDQVFINASDEATATYEIGRDVAKAFMSGEVKCAQLYVPAYGTKLCAADFQLNSDDEAMFPLTITAPKAGTYTLALDNAQKNATVYLMQNGAIIWNLSQGAYEMDLAKGTNNEYTLVMKVDKSDVITGSDVINTQADGIQKFIYDEKLILIHNGNVYNGAGARMK